MIILGVTGSVGMGKTEAGKYFIRNNIDVFDCDKKIATFYNSTFFQFSSICHISHANQI